MSTTFRVYDREIGDYVDPSNFALSHDGRLLQLELAEGDFCTIKEAGNRFEVYVGV